MTKEERISELEDAFKAGVRSVMGAAKNDDNEELSARARRWAEVKYAKYKPSK